MLRLLLYISIFWILIHLINNYYLTKKTKKSRSTLSTTTTFSLTFISFHLSTSAFNQLPLTLLYPFRKKRSKGFNSNPTTLKLFWDLGVVFTIFGIFVAQFVLIWTALKSLSALWTLFIGNSSNINPKVALKVVKRLVKRMIELTPSAASSLIIRPVIPGLTLPLSTLPLLLLALLSSQAFHELGHAMAAASESISIISTGLHFYIMLPTFYVSLPESSASKFSDLRIATAGVWYNLVLVLFVLGLSEKGLGFGKLLGKGMFRDVDGGLLVVDVELSSPLSTHLSPYSLITHLNDLELDSSGNPNGLWSSYLSGLTSIQSSYENLGWCLPLKDFNEIPKECCLPPPTPTSPSMNSTVLNPLLCFSIPSISTSATSTTKSESLTACLNPLPLFQISTSKIISPRCLISANCVQKGESDEDKIGCARPVDGEKVLRIGVGADTKGEESKIIVWQGNWKGVLEQVSVSSISPRFWLIPLSLPRTIERFYSHVVSLSLALAFFNLLPLPHLDGSHIVNSFFQCLSSFSDDVGLEAGLQSPILLISNAGLLEKTLEQLSKNKSIKKLVLNHNEIARGLRIWTIGIATLTLFISLMVEIGSHYASTA